MNELIAFAACAWILAALLGLLGRWETPGRALLVSGTLLLIVEAIATLPGGTAPLVLPVTLTAPVVFALSPTALWLMGFGLAPAALACALGTPAEHGRHGWQFGAACMLLGTLGVFGFQEGAAFLISWELMSLGGAVMILRERLASPGRPVLFMLALLETGSVAILAAFLLLGGAASGFMFSAFAAHGATLPTGLQVLAGVLLILGFGAKLGLLPFYEWFPAAYGAGSGASGALLSGVVLNAAYFALARGLLNWLPGDGAAVFGLGVVLIAWSVVTSILAILYAFQEEDWRKLLSLSTAENAAIAAAALGAALLFRHAGLPLLAGLAWAVALLHLAGHGLAKGALLLCADGVYHATGKFLIRQAGLVRRGGGLLALGALVAAMSLAAMPPTAGFVSEWYVFQTLFQGFHLPGLAGRLVLALAGAGLALTAAVAFATFVKVFGLGLLGEDEPVPARIPARHSLAVLCLGLLVLITAVGMPWWLGALTDASQSLFGANAPASMRHGWLLVPLTADFAFISPAMLVIAGPLLALLPLALWRFAPRRQLRRAPVWYGGLPRSSERVATSALAFSNALRTFYSFIYRPTLDVEHEHPAEQKYFVRRLRFNHKVAPVFGPRLFAPLVDGVRTAAARVARLQSGHLNAYVAIIGLILALILLLPILS